MFCPECGSSNQSGFKFCPNCGFEIGKIHLKNDNELNQIKVSTKIVDFPSEVWNKLVITKEDIDLFIEHGGHADIMFDDEEVVYTQEIIDIQNKFVLTKADIDLLISSINSDYNCIVDNEDEELSDYFFGQFKNGQRHGFVCFIRGTKYEEDAEMKYVITYSGCWVNDKREGFGIEINKYDLTPSYVGEWKDGSRHGNGIAFYSRKEKYVGAWENDSYNGFGIKYYDNGEKEDEGQFKNDRLNGQGCSYFYDPIGVLLYEGLFENGILLNGIEYYNDGQKKYEGTFKDGNILNGIEYIDGIKRYEGEFKYDEETLEDGIWNGKGKYFYDDGVYEGDFVDNVKTGKGKITLDEGSVLEGDFIDGKLNGKGKKTFSNGWCFEGDFVNNLQEGKGQSKHANGEMYIGNYLNGIPTGDFEYININGESVLGHFKSTRVGNNQNDQFFAYDLKTNNSKSNDNQSPIPPKDGAGLR